MYCKHCGKQIADDSKFCPACGGAQGESAVFSPQTSNTNFTVDKLNSQPIEIYLNDVLNLEVAVKHLNECDSQISTEIEKTKQWGLGNDILYPPMPDAPQKPAKPFYEDISFGDAAAEVKYPTIFICSIFAFIFFIFKSADSCTDNYGLCNFEYGCGSFFGNILITIVFTGIIALIITGISWLVMHFKGKKQYTIDVQLYNERTLKKYEEDKEKYNNHCERQRQKRLLYYSSLDERKKQADSKIDKLNSSLETVRNDLNTAETLLKKAYDVNIIPHKYRSLYPVYFIHDYIASSGQSLENALLHCQLDKLETQLGAIIKTNYMIILQNAVQIAQNNQMLANQDEMIQNQEISLENDRRAEAQRERIIDQNKAILDAELENARNTAEAAKYSRIAAINSDTTAFFSTYDHLK